MQAKPQLSCSPDQELKAGYPEHDHSARDLRYTDNTTAGRLESRGLVLGWGKTLLFAAAYRPAVGPIPRKGIMGTLTPV
jgi:hypothetical protein